MARLGIVVPGVYLYKADVGGVMSADPKIVPGAYIISHLTGDEAAALAKLGGKVLHPKAVAELRGTNIPFK